MASLVHSDKSRRIMTTIYRIKLHKNLEAENFTKFIVEKIFPAIPKVRLVLGGWLSLYGAIWLDGKIL